MNKDHIWKLVANKLSGEASPEEIRELDQLRSEDPEIDKYIAIISYVWNTAENAGKEEAQRVYHSMLARLENKNSGAQKRSLKQHINPVMLTNYFKIAFRNMTRHRSYAAINILGLAFGICACIVIYLITSFEFSFDKFHPDGDRIYRIVGEAQDHDGKIEFLNSPIGDLAALENEIPGFESKSAFHTSDRGATVTIPQPNGAPKKFDNIIPNSYSATTIITWPAYFSVFNYQWLAGTPASLHSPFKIVLTESRAKQYFGNVPLNSMMGRTVVYDDSLKLTVSGIVKDWKGNTDFGYTNFISISTATHSFLKKNIPTDDWSSLRPHSSMTLVKLNKSVSAAQVNDRFAAFIKQHLMRTEPSLKLRIYLQPLSDVHFTNEYRRGDDGDDFRKAYLPTLYILIGVAAFILLIAIFNFVNLSTAQSLYRVKEIGVRKVMGGKKINIMLQFLVETFCFTCLAVAISILLVNPVLHLFSDYIPEGITFQISNSSTIIFLVAITAATTFFAGFYPARMLASYLPAVSLKGEVFSRGKTRLNVRHSLIIFQFTFSLIFIIATLVMSKQTRFMMTSDKGFNTDAIITINKWGDQSGKLKTLAEEIRHITGVDKVILQGNAPMGFAQRTITFQYKGAHDINLNPILELGDEGYIPFYKMKLIAGRNLLHADSLTEIVINKTMSEAMGFNNATEAVGKFLYQTTPAGIVAVPIVGVISDFHQGSFHDVIQPAVIGNIKGFDKTSIAIKLLHAEKNTAEVKNVLSGIEKMYKSTYPESNFNYSFLNESISWLYGQEEKTAWLLRAATIITIFISCMGLFGLVMFTARKRTKEIGIRKVLGASVASISTLLCREFIYLVAVAFLIAAPIAYFVSNKWLEDFAYRTSIDGWIFLEAGIVSALIAIIAVSFQAVKAAIANPVNSLRSE